MSGASRKVSAIVSTQWLSEHLSKANIRILDGSWNLPNQKIDAKGDYRKTHIPGAQFFDIDSCCTESKSPHMLPNAEKFENYVGSELGINNETHVVVYDNNKMFGMFSAQRVWWTFRVFGHNNVSVMEGGLPQWRKEERAVTAEVGKVVPQAFKAQFQSHLVKSYEEMERNLSDSGYQVMDARPAGRFQGTAPEPREDTKSGCIPGSHNVPFAEVQDAETRCMKNPQQLKEIFTKAGVDLDKPLTATCGSGISAGILALAAYQCGKEDVAVYDGSWTEWYHRAPAQNKKNVPQD